MWFKQAKIFELAESFRYTPDALAEKLEGLAYKECLPSMPYGSGWIAPVDDEDMPLVQAMNGYLMICLQVEEKILPPMVIRQELAKKIKQIEKFENRKVGPKERYSLKDELITTLLPRAFSKLTSVYAYLSPNHRRLVLSVANAKKTEQFLLAFQKTFGETIHAIKIKQLSTLMTAWLKNQNHSSAFSIEKSCVLQDANQQDRVIRCKEQDLFASSIQALIKDGCEITQLALNWQDRVDFVLSQDCALQTIRFQDEILMEAKSMEAGTKQQQFNADFFLMTQTLEGLLKDLLSLFTEQSVKNVAETAEA